jgi:hypothetical protein
MSTAASREAYASIADRLPAKRGRVYTEIRTYGGTTINDGCRLTGWAYSTVSARFYELAEDGLIKDSGAKRDGQTVWVVSEPEEREGLRAARKARKNFEAAIDGFTTDPATFGQADDKVMVHVAVPRDVWAKMKSTIRVRFI